MPSVCACGTCGLQVSNPGVFRKGHQPAGTSRDPDGKEKARNDVNNAKVQERARVDNEERIAKMPKHEDILSEANAAALAEELSTTATGALQGCTLEELMGLDEEWSNIDKMAKESGWQDPPPKYIFRLACS